MLTKWLRNSTAAAVAALFANGEAGAVFIAQKPAEWGGVADLVTMYVDDLGTTPVTALEQTVGLHLDTRPILLGPELVVNGRFATDLSGWTNNSIGTGTVTWSAGAAAFSSTDASNRAELQQTPALRTGATYQVSFTVNGTQQMDVTFSNNLGVSKNYLAGGTTTTFQSTVTGNSGLMLFRVASSNGTNSLDNVSVREVIAAPNTVGQPLRGTEQVTNGALTTSTGWADASSAGGAVAFGAGGATITNTSGVARLQQTLTVLANSWNELRYDLSGVTTGTPVLSIGSTGGGTDYYSNTAITAGVAKRLMFFSTTNQAFVNFAANTAGAMVVVNVSSKIVYGNHRKQSSAPARARLSARYNRITCRSANPTDLTNTGFTNAPNALATLAVVNDAAALAASGLSSKCTLGNVYKLDNTLGNGTAAVGLVASASPTATSSQQVSVWTRGTFTAATQLTGNDVNWATALVSGATYTRVVATGKVGVSTTSAIKLNVAAGEVLYFILPDQRDNCYGYLPNDQTIIGTGATAADYDDTGFPARLVYNNAQFYTTGAVDFSGSAAAQSFTGLGSLSNASATVLLELTADATANNGGFLILVNGGLPAAILAGVRGTLFTAVRTPASFTAPATAILSTLWDSAQATELLANVIRANGVVQAQTSTNIGNPAGTGLANAALAYGAHAAGTNPITADEFISIVRGGATPTVDIISTVERFVGQKMSISL